MKRSLLIVVLAAALVFAVGSVAMAKYAGYAYNNPVLQTDGTSVENPNPGYISWEGAKALMTLNGVPAELQLTPHGGYTVNTSKCAVCHSTHRAATDATAAGVGSYWKLTPGGASCTACHTPHGANPVSTLVEWPAVYSDGGPHARQQCTGACHAGIHGAGGSQYGTMNRFLLNGANDPAIAAAFAAGNTWTVADSAANDAANGGGRGEVTEATFQTYGIGVQPIQKEATTQRALRAMATGYTCGPAGCHSSSQFAVNREGYAEARASDPRASSNLDTLFTGHLTNMTYGCPPCHMNMNEPVGRDSDCALCHDMIGQATGTSAFPHANRNIAVLETADGINWAPRTVDAGNLWMYVGDATRRDASGNSAPTGTIDPSRVVLERTSDGKYNLKDGMCLKCHAYANGAHINGSGATSYNKADGTPTGNILDFSHF